MIAVCINNFGPVLDLDVKEIENVADPGTTEVLIRVRSAGVNRADLLQARGHYPPPAGYSPNLPGLEFAGEIVGIGDSVIDWEIGDRVFGITAGEAQAEYAVVDANLIARIPDRLSFNEAAAIPEAFITAHDALITQCRLTSGENLLIHAIGSGVGLAGLQIAKATGARVIGTSRTADKIDRCRDLGLDGGLTINDPAAFEKDLRELTSGEGMNVILDLVGASYFQENIACLAENGRLILVGLTSGAQTELNLSALLQKRAQIMGTTLRGRTIAEKGVAIENFVRDVVPLLESGVIRANLDRVFPVSDAIAAYKYLASNVTFGKVVLEV